MVPMAAAVAVAAGLPGLPASVKLAAPVLADSAVVLLAAAVAGLTAAVRPLVQSGQVLTAATAATGLEALVAALVSLAVSTLLRERLAAAVVVVVDLAKVARTRLLAEWIPPLMQRTVRLVVAVAVAMTTATVALAEHTAAVVAGLLLTVPAQAARAARELLFSRTHRAAAAQPKSCALPV